MGANVKLGRWNEYLAMRDAAWMGEIYHALGLTTGCITHSESYVYDPTHQNPSDPLDKERDAEGGFKIVHEFLRPVLKAQAYKADIIILAIDSSEPLSYQKHIAYQELLTKFASKIILYLLGSMVLTIFNNHLKIFITNNFPPEFQNGFEGYTKLRDSI